MQILLQPVVEQTPTLQQQLTIGHRATRAHQLPPVGTERAGFGHQPVADPPDGAWHQVRDVQIVLPRLQLHGDGAVRILLPPGIQEEGQVLSGALVIDRQLLQAL